MPNTRGEGDKNGDPAQGALQICSACLVPPCACYEQAIPIRRAPCLCRLARIQRDHAELWQSLRERLLDHPEVLRMQLGEIANVLQNEN